MEMDAQDAFSVDFFERALKRDPRDFQILENLGGLYAKYDMVKQTLGIDRRLVRIDPENPRLHYNLACSLCLSNRKRDALRSLSQAIDLGYDDADWMGQDRDLEALRSHPEFKALIKRINPSN